MDAIFVHDMLNIINERENNEAFDATTIKEKQAKDIVDFGDLLEQTLKGKPGSSTFMDFIEKCKKGALVEDLILHTYFERSTKTISKLLHKGYYGFKKLGTGTYGIDTANIHGDVILVSSKTDGQEYAVKYLSLNSDLEKAKKEIKRETYLSTLNHPNIVRYFHSWTENFNKEDSDEDSSDSNDDTTNRRIYIQMEYCECGTIRELINSKQFIGNIDLLWYLFRGTLNGLVYIHRRKIVHKDLKPENIFFDRSLSAKIGDFGCATVQLRPEREDMENLGLLNSSTAAGSKPYAPLDTPIDTPFDIHSMGVILFELFLPLENAQLSEAIEKKKHNNFPEDFANWAKRLKLTDLQIVIKTMLSISPGNRPTAEKILEITPPVRSQKMFKISYEK
uniref:Protein kinase domain-containing protein n=2 Tax=Panagrolaimus sp. PS1159 TaxID=55785 RepID=A0AC35GL34_9BILA